MKKLLLLLFLINTINIYPNDDEQILTSIFGAKVIFNSKTKFILKLKDTTITISKKRFLSEKLASSFCKKEESILDDSFIILALAMVGVNNYAKEITKLMVFRIHEDFTGIWQWTGKGKNKVTLMKDGGGSSTDSVLIDRINTVLESLEKSNAKLPAVCVK